MQFASYLCRLCVENIKTTKPKTKEAPKTRDRKGAADDQTKLNKTETNDKTICQKQSKKERFNELFQEYSAWGVTDQEKPGKSISQWPFF